MDLTDILSESDLEFLLGEYTHQHTWPCFLGEPRASATPATTGSLGAPPPSLAWQTNGSSSDAGAGSRQPSQAASRRACRADVTLVVQIRFFPLSSLL